MGITLSYQRKNVPNGYSFNFGGTCFKDFQIKLANEYDNGLGAVYESMLRLGGAFENDPDFEDGWLKVINVYLTKLKPPACLGKFLFNRPDNFDAIGRISPRFAGIIYNLIKDWKDNYIKEYWANEFKMQPFIEFFKRAHDENLVILYYP